MTNQVEISGNLVGEPSFHIQADGTEVIQWRMRVSRDGAGNDSIPCSSSVSKVKKFVEKVSEDKVFVAHGEIRSRYWRSAGGTQSRIEVDVTSTARE